MVEAVGAFTGVTLGATYFRGSKPIVAVWTTDDLEVVNACMMPVGYGVGDHRMFVLDFAKTSFLGSEPKKIVRPQARRLNTLIDGATETYVDRLEDLYEHHKVAPKLITAHRDAPDSESARSEVNNVDKLSEDLMKNAERKCRKLKNGRIPFSPESSIWIRRCQVYQSLLRFKAGKIRNRGNLKRAARCYKIQRALSLSAEELHRRLKVCKEQCKYFRRHGKRYQRRHLQHCLERAQDQEDNEGEKKILRIIQREKDRAFWRRLNFILKGRTRGRGVDWVQTVESDGSTREVRDKEGVKSAIWGGVHKKRFYLAEQAPICNGNLRGKFGYRAATPASKEVLEGTFDYDEEEMDDATRDLLQ
ncbi:hypothetical protein ACHAWF_008680, partial [Thalassiosira exigua]